jgi:deoxycytidylate deaminase
VIEASTGLSSKDKAFLRLAMKVAETSACGLNKHGCVVVKSGSVLSLGVNKNRNLGITGIKKGDYTIHAEMDALNRPHDFRGCTVYVARVSIYGKPRLARPCPECYNAIVANGIKDIIYTIDGEDYGLDLRQMQEANTTVDGVA